MGEKQTTVIVVGAGPAGIAISACLNLLSIPNIVLERDDCCASLWKKRSYDRLKLHLAKQYCSLPNMPFPPHTPTFVPRISFINYLDTYVSNFRVKPLYNRSVESASQDGVTKKWRVVARNVTSEEVEVYVGEFLVVATGENSVGLVPAVNGLKEFRGEILHSNEYVNGEIYKDKDVLVVGSGNSGMEIAYDLSNWGAKTSISVRSPVHVLTKEMVQLGMFLLKYFSCTLVDKLVLLLSKFKYGNFARYGLPRPTKGPFYLKLTTGRSPVIDVGTMEKIKSGNIQVFPTIAKIQEDNVLFVNDSIKRFDAIVFATGYKSNVQTWLKDGKDLFNENGMPKRTPPGHWKGENRLYAVGFARAGLAGIKRDAENVAKDIQTTLLQQNI